VVTLLAGALLLVLGRFARGPSDQKEETLEAVLLTAAAVAFAAAAAADLPTGLSGIERLAPGSGRALLQGGVAALFGGWLAVRAIGRWRHLAG
jgi:hypothetical protein